MNSPCAFLENKEESIFLDKKEHNKSKFSANLNKSVDYEGNNNMTPLHEFESIHHSLCTDKSTMMKIYGVLTDN